MIEVGGCLIAAHRHGPLLSLAVSGDLTLEWAAAAANEVWLAADASDAPVVALDVRGLRAGFQPGAMGTVGAMRPPTLRRKAWCMVTDPDKLGQAEAISRAYRSSGDELEVFTSFEAAEAWSRLCA